jgi:hypothetical protein
MKANRSNVLARNNEGFSFIVPLTMAVVIGIALLVMGTFVVGEITSALEGTYPTNIHSGSVNNYYNHTDFAQWTTYYRNITLPSYCTAGDLQSTNTYFNVSANTSANVRFNLTINDITAYTNKDVNGNSYIHTTLATFIANSSAANSNTTLNFAWAMNATAVSNVYIRVNGEYFTGSDYRSANENNSVSLLGNITDGFSDIVDIEIVVIIIAALSMAIFTILAVGTRPSF